MAAVRLPESKCKKIDEEILKCLKCSKQFDEEHHHPRVLPCLDIYCSTCLAEGVNELQCCFCGKKYEVSEDSLDTFVVDYTRMDLVHFYNTFHQNTTILCNCQQEGKSWCKDCESFLCNTCRDSHKKTRKQKNHKVCDISDIKEPSDFLRERLCEVHDEKPLDEYCKSCRTPLCSDCWRKDHIKEDHEIVDIKSVFEEERDNILSKAETTKKKFENIETHQGQIDEEIANVSRQTIAAEFEITSFFNRCIRILEKRKECLLEQLNSLSEEKQNILRNQKVELSALEDSLFRATTFLDHSSLSQNPAAFLSLVPTISKQFEALDNIVCDNEPDMSSTISFFIKDKGKEFETMAKTLGDVLVLEVCPNNSEISVSRTIKKNENNTFEVTLRDCSGNVVNDNVFMCAILKDSEGKRAKINFITSGEGIFSADCTIKRQGVYDVQILLNGQQFKDIVTIECVDNESDSYDSSMENEEGGYELFCNGDEYPDSNEDCGSSDVYLECEEAENGSDVVDNEELELDSIIVTGFATNTTEDEIKRCFSNKQASGTDAVSDVKMNKDDGFCIVTLSNPDDLQNICRRKHEINGQKLMVEIYDKSELKIPAPVRIKNLERHKLQFLQTSVVSREVLDKRMQLIDATIDWSSNEYDDQSLEIKCNLTPKTDGYKKKASLWKRCVEREVAKFFETLHVAEQKIKPDEWDVLEESVLKIPILDDRRVVIQGDKTKLFFIIVGYKVPFMEVTNKVLLLTSDVTVQERLETFEISLLTNGKVLEDINNNFKGIKIIPNGTKGVIEFAGTAGIVAKAKEKMASVLQNVVSVPVVGFSKEKIKFLQTPTVHTELETFLKEQKILGAWKVGDDNTLVVYSLSETVAKTAADVVKESVVEVDMNSQSDLKQWNEEVEDMKKKKGGQVQVKTDNNKVIIFAIPKSNAKAIEEHVKIFQKYPDKKVRGTTHFTTQTGQTITTIVGDITDLDNDVIVCSSSTTLNLSIGVGGDLVKKGGIDIQLECNQYLNTKPNKALDQDEVFCSKAGKLRCKMVAHVGGKSWENNPEKAKASLLNVVKSSLTQTDGRRFASIAIPALFTGSNKYPVKEVTDWIVEAIHLFLGANGKRTSIQNIYLCDILKDRADSFAMALKKYYSLTYERE